MPILAGWLIDDDGKANVTDAAVSNARYLHGAAFTDAGVRYVELYSGSLPAGAVHIAGTAHTSDGAMLYVASLPSPAFVLAGIVHNADGAMYLANGAAADVFMAGKGLTNAGALTVTGL